MRTHKVAKTLIQLVVLSLINSPLSHSQARKPAVTIKIDEENYKTVAGKGLVPLYTIIRGRQYFIDRLQRMSGGLPEPLVDPTGSYIFYASNTGCGYEQEGSTLFVSDVYGKIKLPILGRCAYLTPSGFLSFQGKNYLLVSEGNSGTSESNAFWLYDVSRREFVVHAEGEIGEMKKGVFSYGYYVSDAEFKEIGTITMSTLIRRGPPLRLLPRYPTHGITQKRRVRAYETSGPECYIDSDKQYKTISTPGTRVVILAECDDGGYEIYFEGFKGKVMKGSVRPIKFGPRN